MKLINHAVRRIVYLVAVLAVAGPGGPAARAAEGGGTTATNNPEADKAWREVNLATRAPAPPLEWRTNEPSQADVAQFFGPLAVKAADKAKDFYTRFPDHPKATEAHAAEYRSLSMAVSRFDQTNQATRLLALETQRLKDPSLSEDERYNLRIAAIRRLNDGLPGTQDEMEKAARALMKDFPKRDETFSVLLMVAREIGGEKATALAKEIEAGAAPDQVKEQARGMIKQAEALGKPVGIKFTALDGRGVDVTNMKGKVVLIDFWATWCGPCVGELPHVKAAYEKLHSQGFEIVGISFDKDRDALENFVAKEKTEWPQYFDGLFWDNKYGKEFGIHSIPTMWLVDKKGNLRDMNGRDGLADKVAKLLAEQ